MSALPIIITTAGLNALPNAQNTGVSNVVIASMGVSPTQIAATAATTAIPGEVKRIVGVSGQVVADDQIYISAADQTQDTYVVRTIGLYLDTGVLFAVYSQAAPLLEKAGPAMAVLEAAIKLSSPQANAIEFSGGGWLNPQASETVQGVLRLATEAEAKAGTNTTRAVTPKGLKGAIDVVVAWINQEFNGIAQALAGKAAVGHTHAMAQIDGLVAALAAKAAAAHTHVMADITGLVDALNSKAAAVHTHAMSEINGLTNALAGKAAAAHTHVMAEVSGLAEALAGKAAAAHTHVMSEIAGLANALAGKSDNGHTHAVGDVAGVMPMTRSHNTPSPDAAALGASSGDFDMGDGYFGWHYLTLRRLASNFGVQIALTDTIENQKLRFRRRADDGSFSAWREVWTTVNFNPNDKAPALHSHDWTQVTGKPDLVPQNRSHGVANPDAAPQGLSSGDMDLNGHGLAGWQLFTSRRAGDNYGTQLAISDTTDRMLMRRYSNGAWQSWKRVWSDSILLPATAGDAANGVSNDHFITPAALWSFARSTGSPGYAVIPGTGLMIQWGLTASSLSEGETHAYLPVAFGGGCLVALANPRNPTRSIGIDFYMQVVGHFADRIAFFANRGNSSSGNVAGYEWVALGRVSGSPDPAYTENGGGGGGGGNPEIIP